LIRPARPDDAQAIAEIWNKIIRDTIVTFTTAEKDPHAIATAIADGMPYHVAEDDTGILGFVTACQFRGGPGYAHTFEHSIHLIPRAQGRGLGRALMTTIEEDLKARGAHTLFAGVSGENEAGVTFHAALGYAHVARLPEVGRKFGRWHDLILMQKFL
jgi:L-amino acid N-acyltransferase YncA